MGGSIDVEYRRRDVVRLLGSGLRRYIPIAAATSLT
jgi:hypothetical protein